MLIRNFDFLDIYVEQHALQRQAKFGELFFDICDELPDITWEKAFLLLLDTFLDISAEKYFLADDELEYLLGAFVDTLPELLKNSILRCA